MYALQNAKDIKNEDDSAHRQTDVINSRIKPVIKIASQIDRIVIPMGQIERHQNLAPALDLSIRCSDEAPALDSGAPRAPGLMNQALPVPVFFDPPRHSGKSFSEKHYL
jgi:hypothetical protein